MALPLRPLFNSIFEHASARRFLLAAIAGLAFSISVILCTIGLMDGFEKSLKGALKKANGDIILINKESFFDVDDKLKQTLGKVGVLEIAPQLQSEGMAVIDSMSKGVVLLGIYPDSFKKVTAMDVSIKNGVGIGIELAKAMNLKVGDEIGLIMASGNQHFQGLPTLERVHVESIVTHGIYEKDLRLVYLPLPLLKKWMNISKEANQALLKVGENPPPKLIEKMKRKILDILPPGQIVRPYWSEYAAHLEAVEVEKTTITMILQLIVVMAIFNVAAMMIFLSERKAKEFFLFRALGLNLKGLAVFWFAMISFVWFLSCFLSFALTQFFNYLLKVLPFFQMPGDIYVLSKLELSLDWNDYILVYGFTFLWLILLVVVSLFRLSRRSPLYGMRREFS